jgi:molybdopterin synthase sulfur carrier subunit
VKVLYFAWVRQKIGRSEEEFEAPPSVTDVTGLIDYLRARGPQYEAAFRDSKALRCAVNQEHAGFETKIVAGDEIAFFPPVTGG